jgi:hypothetical protein
MSGEGEAMAGELRPGRCPVCAEPIPPQPWRCQRCETPHHAECAEYFGGCAIFGCRDGHPPERIEAKTWPVTVQALQKFVRLRRFQIACLCGAALSLPAFSLLGALELWLGRIPPFLFLPCSLGLFASGFKATSARPELRVCESYQYMAMFRDGGDGRLGVNAMRMLLHLMVLYLGVTAVRATPTFSFPFHALVLHPQGGLSGKLPGGGLGEAPSPSPAPSTASTPAASAPSPAPSMNPASSPSVNSQFPPPTRPLGGDPAKPPAASPNDGLPLPSVPPVVEQKFPHGVPSSGEVLEVGGLKFPKGMVVRERDGHVHLVAKFFEFTLGEPGKDNYLRGRLSVTPGVGVRDGVIGFPVFAGVSKEKDYFRLMVINGNANAATYLEQWAGQITVRFDDGTELKSGDKLLTGKVPKGAKSVTFVSIEFDGGREARAVLQWP